MKSTNGNGAGEGRGTWTGKTVLTLLGLWILTACESGGGEGGDEDFGLKPTPSVVTFSMETGGVPLTVELAGADIEVAAVLSGFYNLDIDEWATDAATTLSIDSGPLFGTLEVAVFDRLQGAAWDQPRSGTLVIRQVSTGDLVTVSVNSAAGGVDLFYDEGGTGANVLGPFTYTWEELAALFGTSPAEYEELASYAWAVVQLARERFLVVLTAFVEIFTTAPSFESIGAEMRFGITDACGTLPGSGNIGDGIIVWHDVDGAGRVDDGDAFTVTLEDCWVDTPGRFDRLLDGVFELTGFSCSSAPFATAANIEFDGLQERATEEAGGVFSIVPGSDSVTRGSADASFD